MKTIRRLAPALALLSILAAEPSLAAPALVTGSQPEFAITDPALTVLRERTVSLNRGSLAKSARDGTQMIDVEFFPDARFTIAVKRTEATQSGGIAYSGTVLGSPLHPAVIVDNGGVISAKVVVNGRRYSLKGSAETGYTAREHLDYDKRDHPATTTLDLTGSQFLTRYVPTQGAKAAQAQVAQVGDSNNIIDVMIVYTPAARAQHALHGGGNQAQIDADIDAEIVITNDVYANSGVVQRVRLVYKGEVPYTETNIDMDLGRITTVNDGYMDTVPILRDVYKADFVSLWGVYPTACGLGWLMSSESANFESLGYNVVAEDCFGPGAYTFAHELGHNMGLRHDAAVDGAITSVTPEAGGPLTTIAYAHGYVDTTNRFRTVMAYNDACIALAFNCSRAPHFSNPGVSYLNPDYVGAVLAPTGFVTIPGVPVGGGPFEALALNDTRETTQNFRQPALVSLTGPGSLLFAMPTYTVAEGGGNVVLTVGRHIGSTGAISVNYTTANGTATAGADYTLTTGTLNWANGDTADKTITVPVLQDTLLEGTETFTVTLSAPTGGATIAAGRGSATVRITDDEPDTFPVSASLPGGFVSPNNPNPNTPSTVWTVDMTDGYLSPTSLQSARVFSPDNQFQTFGNSDLEYTNTFQAGTVSFFYKLSSYQLNFSGFEFSIDGVVVFANNVGGEVNWTPVSQPITAGLHTLRWRFKNLLPFACAGAGPTPAEGGTNCADRAWIDSLVMPISRPYDFSGDGKTDLLVRHTDGRVSMWLMNGGATTSTVQLLGPGTGFDVSHVDDLNGDGKSDLVFRHTDGRVVVYTMNGTTITGSATLLGPGSGFTVMGTGDFNGDGKADLIFQHTDGRVVIYTMNGVTVAGGGTILGPGTGFTVTKVADFNGDGKDDILWTHTDGRVAIWLMNGPAVAGGGTILAGGSGFSAIHTADLNGDGKADIVWRHTDGRIAVWMMDGASVIGGGTLFAGGTGWNVARTGDFNGDGKSDLLWMHTDGRAAIWLMNGFTAVSVVQIMNAGGGWTPKRTGDLDGNGKADIVWENVDGRIVVWLMNGTALAGGGTIQNAGAGWTVNTVSP